MLSMAVPFYNYIDENEKSLFDLLLQCVSWQKEQPQQQQLNIFAHDDHDDGTNSNTILRVAGGWVRDKLLGNQCSDIDIAISNQSGISFATAVNEYLMSKGCKTQSIAVIQANPEQSKHLETATVKILGFDVDFVNLRAETYAENSRIPEMRIGTPTEDALRRDFSINALFYNINESTVEDFTGKGLSDLSIGLIRTPISAHITFLDDPLRVLRAIRFSSRFNFRLDEELEEATKEEDVRAALSYKVSRERIYKECEGIFAVRGKANSYDNIADAFRTMNRLLILDAVLPVEQLLSTFPVVPRALIPPQDTQISTWRDKGMLTLDSIRYFINSGVAKGIVHVKELVWAALLVGLHPIKVCEKNRKEVPLVTVVLREGLKMETHTIRNVQLMVDSIAEFQSFVCDSNTFSQEAAGLLLRNCKELWTDCLWLAAAAANEHNKGENLDQIAANYSSLYAGILSMGLDGIWTLKPLMNGEELIDRLGLSRGPLVGAMMEEQVRWQLRFRSEDVSACCAYLEQRVPAVRESMSVSSGGSSKRSGGQNQQSKRNRECSSLKS